MVNKELRDITDKIQYLRRKNKKLREQWLNNDVRLRYLVEQRRQLKLSLKN